MSVFEALVQAYQAEGIETASGLNPTLTQDYFGASFTWLVKDGESVTDGLGISPVEVYFLESLAKARPARRIFVIGNAYGWSTLALALANDGAEVVAIDAGFDENTIQGIDVTNRMAERLGLNVKVLKAVSPQDVGAVVRETLGHVDLAFIDGLHTPSQIVKDWRAVRSFLDDDGLVLFHDVVFCDLLSGYERIVEESGWTGRIMHATTTGMGLLAREYTPALDRLATAFGGHPGAIEVVRAQAREKAHLSGTRQREEVLEYLREVEARSSAPGTVTLRNLNGVDIVYRSGTTDEAVLEEEYAAARFFPEGFEPAPDATILDVGAHIGVFAALIARRVPQGAVHALEPSLENFGLLQQNLRNNGADNVTAHRLALAGENGTLRLYHAPGSVGHSFYRNPEWEGEPWEPRPEDAPPPREYEDVRTQVLADFLDEHRIDRVDFMKMNIEGAEYDVLLNASEKTLNAIAWMCVELHPETEGRADRLVERLREAGFHTEFTAAEDNPWVVGWLTARQ